MKLTVYSTDALIEHLLMCSQSLRESTKANTATLQKQKKIIGIAVTKLHAPANKSENKYICY